MGMDSKFILPLIAATILVISLVSIYFYKSSYSIINKDATVNQAKEKTTEKEDKNESENEEQEEEQEEKAVKIEKKEADSICEINGLEGDKNALVSFDSVKFFENSLKTLDLVINKVQCLNYTNWDSFKALDDKQKEFFNLNFVKELKKLRTNVYENFSAKNFDFLEKDAKKFKVNSSQDKYIPSKLSVYLRNVYCLFLVSVEKPTEMKFVVDVNLPTFVKTLSANKQFEEDLRKHVLIDNEQVKLSNLYSNAILQVANAYIDYCSLNIKKE